MSSIMLASRRGARAVARTAPRRALRAPIRSKPRNARFQHRDARDATREGVDEARDEVAAEGFSAGLVGGLTGGALMFSLGYAYYHLSGAKQVVQTAKATKQQFDKVTNELKQKAPSPNEALPWLKDTAEKYARFVPGGKAWVDTVFRELEDIAQKHEGEVKEIVNSTYNELNEATEDGLGPDSVSRAWDAIQRAVDRIRGLSRESAGSILGDYPKLREKVGGSLEELKRLTERYGEKGKQELQDTYNKIKDTLKNGVNFDTANRIKQIIQEKTEKIKRTGDEDWKRNIEPVRPYLDQNPQIKEIVEGNVDDLMQADMSELFVKVKDAVLSGKTDELKEYVRRQAERVGDSSGTGKGFEQYVRTIPGGSWEILPRWQKLQELARTRGDDAEKILKEAYRDILDVLQKRIGEAEKVAVIGGSGDNRSRGWFSSGR